VKGEIDVHRLALAVIRTTEEQLRDAYARLVCLGAFRSAEDDATCQACSLPLAYHFSAWVEEFLRVPPEEFEAVAAARRIHEALEEHADCKHFFVAEAGSTFPLFCRLLGEEPARKREQLRPLLFFPWSPIQLRRAIDDAPRTYERLKKRRYRERRDAA
jgi:hypothetical protein